MFAVPKNPKLAREDRRVATGPPIKGAGPELTIYSGGRLLDFSAVLLLSIGSLKLNLKSC